ncbi:MAG: methyl-accepting chemotaxis protein [Bryobacteraceae bacterium]
MSARIWLVVGLCLLVGGSGITVLVYELKGTSAHYEATLRDLQERSHQQDAARIMQVTFKKEVQEWKDILLRGYNPEDLAKYSEQFRADAAAVAQSSEALQASIADADARGTIAQFLAAHAAMGEKYQVALQVFAAAKGTNPRQADQLVKGQDRAPTALVDQAVDQLVKRANAVVATEKEAVARTIWMVSVAILAAFAGIGALAIVTIRWISRTLHQAVGGLTEIAQQMTGAASHVSSSSQALAQGASQQAAALEETSASSHEIRSMTQKSSENSRAMADLGMGSQGQFIDTNQKLDQMVVAMQEITLQSEKISKIIKVIDAIAFQTNVLALNAAVEAARAGEAGLGFAVVADEVRNLAQRCTQAAQETTALIEESIAKSKDGKSKVDQVATAIRDITESSAQVKTLIDGVNTGNQQQALAIEHISNAISQMDQVTQQVASSAEQSAAAAEELHAQSASLNHVVENLAAMVGA